MPTALSDPSMSLYAILGVATVLLGIIALRRQKKADLIKFGILALAFVMLIVIDFAVESPREQVVSTLLQMEQASQNKNYDEVFRHVSEQFKYESLDKKGLRSKGQLADNLPSSQGIKITRPGERKFVQIDANTATQEFVVQPFPNIGDTYRYDCIATFKKEDRHWRLIGFVLKQNGESVVPPGF